MLAKRRARRSARFRPAVDRLEPRAAAASLAPTGLEQLLLDRVNALRAGRAASRGVSAPYYQPLVFDGAAKQALARLKTSAYSKVNLIKGSMRRSRVAFEELYSIVSTGGGSGGSTVEGMSPAEQFLDFTGRYIQGSIERARSNRAYAAHRRAGLVIRSDVSPGFEVYDAQIVTFYPRGGGKPLVTGSVYRDLNGNGFNDPGEGVAGASVSAGPGGPAATTTAVGVYVLNLKKPGAYTVTASGGDLAAPLTQTVQVQAKVNAYAPFRIATS